MEGEKERAESKLTLHNNWRSPTPQLAFIFHINDKSVPLVLVLLRGDTVPKILLILTDRL